MSITTFRKLFKLYILNRFMTEAERLILEKLEIIQSEIEEIKHRLDEDSVCSKEDLLAIEVAREEFKKDKTISIQNLKKELGI